MDVEREIIRWSVTAVMVAIAIILFFVWREMIRSSYKRKATDKLTGEKKFRLQVIGKGDTEYMSWGILDSMVIKDERDGSIYPVENVRFVNSWFPEGGLFSSLGLAVQKAVYIEGKPIALVRKDYEAPPTNMTKIAGMLRNEKFVSVMTGALDQFNAMVEKMLQKVKAGEINPMVFYAGVATSILTSIGACVLAYLVLGKLIQAGL